MTGKFGFYGFCLPNPLDKKETHDLFIKMRTGDNEAKEKLILHNLRLVFYIIERKFYNTRYEVEELVSIGNIGLMKALNTFDMSKEMEFSTYASNCIINEILMFLRKYKNDYLLVSLNQPFFTNDKGNDISYADVIPDDVDIIEEYENKDIAIIINECLSKLSDIERECITMHFGLYGVERQSQMEIAKKLNRDQPYVSRIISKATNKIKAELYLMGIIENIKDSNVLILADELESTSTIYQLLTPYTKKEINNFFSILNKKEKKLIKLRYGDDLDNPVKSRFFTEKDKKNFYCVLVRKLRKILAFNRNNEISHQDIVMVKK